MQTADGRFTIVFNGEVYNYAELRRELQNRGVHLRGQSDTEVLVNLFAIHGKEVVDRLEGMFAFVIWDRDREELFMARDPLGIKPLYYWQVDDSIAFASEFRAVLASDLTSKKLCLEVSVDISAGEVFRSRTL